MSFASCSTGWQLNGSALECAGIVTEYTPEQLAALLDPLLLGGPQITLAEIFSQPVAADLAQAWMLGFGLPMTLYLVAWGYGAVLNFINPKQEL